MIGVSWILPNFKATCPMESESESERLFKFCSKKSFFPFTLTLTQRTLFCSVFRVADLTLTLTLTLRWTCSFNVAFLLFKITFL
jgi:hypothetical protein